MSPFCVDNLQEGRVVMQGYAVIRGDRKVLDWAVTRLSGYGRDSIECIGGPLDGDRVPLKELDAHGSEIRCFTGSKKKKVSGIYVYAFWVDVGASPLGEPAFLLYNPL